jgi:hypothetical protein
LPLKNQLIAQQRELGALGEVLAQQELSPVRILMIFEKPEGLEVLLVQIHTCVAFWTLARLMSWIPHSSGKIAAFLRMTVWESSCWNLWN